MADGGVRVISVADGSPAAEAGLEPDDVITTVDGEPLTDLDQLVDAVGDREAGDGIEFEVLRGQEELTLAATLGSRFAAALPDFDLGVDIKAALGEAFRVFDIGELARGDFARNVVIGEVTAIDGDTLEVAERSFTIGEETHFVPGDAVPGRGDTVVVIGDGDNAAISVFRLGAAASDKPRA